MHKGVYRLAGSLRHFPPLHHLVAVGGAAAGGIRVHVLPLELHGGSFLAQGRLDPSNHQDEQWKQDEGLLQTHGSFVARRSLSLPGQLSSAGEPGRLPSTEISWKC